ncbi:uncharacterized protein LOC134258110 [Saccostrea cucullata]|uniref:uncharacterized protein LOC134258110 n=1 Tax=Saccostrea cuccullata TaxID=36930 RepID=UPI002ED1AA50
MHTYHKKKVTCCNIKYAKYIGWLYKGITKFGLFSTDSFSEWLGKVFEKKVTDKIKETGTVLPEIRNKKDITFKQVYELFGKKEICIVVTDVCTQPEEYYYPKTTPDFPVREAVRMSMSIPLLFPPKILMPPVWDEDEYFIDGGVLCNFPLLCFDGWRLSMAEEDSFIARMRSSKSEDLLNMRFDRFDPKDSQRSKTLGLRVVNIGKYLS